MHDRCGIFPHNLIIATFPKEQLHHRLMIAATNTQHQVRLCVHYILYHDYQHYRHHHHHHCHHIALIHLLKKYNH